MVQRRRSICTELPASVPVLTVVSSLLLSTVVELPVSFSFLFSVLPCASPSLCPEPFCIAFFACRRKGAGVRVFKQRQSQREIRLSQVSTSKDGMAPSMVLAAEN